jgi:MFS family permease
MTLLQKFIKNDAMKVDPPEIYSLRVLFIACCACFGGLLFGFDIGTIGGVITMPTFQGAFGITKENKANLSANIVSVMQLGAFAGAWVAIPIADRLGRKPGMFFVAVATIVGVIFQAASHGYLEVMYIGRYVPSTRFIFVRFADLP